MLAAEKVFLNLGTRSVIPDVPGLAAAKPLTHIEALELDRVPPHLFVLGAGYVRLELAQATRHFGSRVTVIEKGRQVARLEDPDVGPALLDLFRDEGTDVLRDTNIQGVEGWESNTVRNADDCYSPPGWLRNC